MPSKSIWLNEKIEEFPRLPGDIKADAVVVGGGMAGLCCAYELCKAGADTVLIEALRVGRGVSGNTTAKVTAQHDLAYSRLIQKWGVDAAQGYAQANMQSVGRIREIAAGENADCELIDQSACIFTAADVGVRKLEEEAKASERAGIAQQVKQGGPPFLKAKATLVMPGQASFHPVKYMRMLVQAIKRMGGRIYEHSRAMEAGEGFVKTAEGKVSADWVVIATHFPIVNFPGIYFAQMYQHRSYVLALNGPKIEDMYLSMEKDGPSFRMAGDTLLIGGADHRSGFQGKTDHYALLYGHVREAFGEAGIRARWSAQDCIPPDLLPFIGAYSKKTPRMLVATGFAKWGMTQSVLASTLIADAVLSRQNPYAGIFSPQRPLLKREPRIFLNGLEAAGIYAEGAFAVTRPICAHMGARLSFNRDEGTWDCKLHGSRFDKDGGVIQGPSVKKADVIKA